MEGAEASLTPELQASLKEVLAECIDERPANPMKFISGVMATDILAKRCATICDSGWKIVLAQ